MSDKEFFETAVEEEFKGLKEKLSLLTPKLRVDVLRKFLGETEVFRKLLDEAEAENTLRDALESLRQPALEAVKQQPKEVLAILHVLCDLVRSETQWGSDWTNDFLNLLDEDELHAELSNPGMEVFEKAHELTELCSDE